MQGNYNATSGPTGDVTPTETHMAASILADAVTLLSNSWNDSLRSSDPNNDASSRRAAATTRPPTGLPSSPARVCRFRIRPAAGNAAAFLFGTDGGVGNFLRLLEDWRPAPAIRSTTAARSSACSTAARRSGPSSAASDVYDYALRNFIFDNNFLLPSLLPPGTPMFRDVNTLTFRQLLRPNQ